MVILLSGVLYFPPYKKVKVNIRKGVLTTLTPGMSVLIAVSPFSLKNSSTTLSTPSMPVKAMMEPFAIKKLTDNIMASLVKVVETTGLATEGNENPGRSL